MYNTATTPTASTPIPFRLNLRLKHIEKTIPHSTPQPRTHKLYLYTALILYSVMWTGPQRTFQQCQFMKKHKLLIPIFFLANTVVRTLFQNASFIRKCHTVTLLTDTTFSVDARPTYTLMYFNVWPDLKVIYSFTDTA